MEPKKSPKKPTKPSAETLLLQKRFGALLSAHRHRQNKTQAALAEAANMSIDMIARIESGNTGVRFPSISKLATALNIDPAELFTDKLPNSALDSPKLSELRLRLANLSDNDLDYVGGLLDAGLKRR